MIRRVEINSDRARDGELRRLYETAFPVEEQIPYDDLIHLLQVMDIDYNAYYEGEMLVGMTMVLRLPRYNWGWYFAMREELRGKGYGQGILTSVLDKYRDGLPFVIDIESPWQPDAPNLEQRKRRHAFYVRNGLKDTDANRTYNGVTFTILSSSDAPFTQENYEEIVSALSGAWENMPGKK